MTDDKKKMTAQNSSVGADDGQSISQNSKFTIPDPDEKSNSPEKDLEELYQKMRRMSDPAYLHTVTLDELMDNVFDEASRNASCTPLSCRCRRSIRRLLKSPALWAHAKVRKIALAICSTPVSYTHLDVYKRQASG